MTKCIVLMIPALDTVGSTISDGRKGFAKCDNQFALQFRVSLLSHQHFPRIQHFPQREADSHIRQDVGQLTHDSTGLDI